MAHKTFFNWSGGKDSALALYQTLQDPIFSVRKLVTSVNSSFNRVSMHGVRTALLEEQAKSIGIPLQKLLVPDQPSMESYNMAMDTLMQELTNDQYTHAVFGDIHLADLRQYREEKLNSRGIKAHFPLWGKDTKILLETFLDLGFKTMIVCVQSDKLPKAFAGRVIDRDFIKDLPSGVDPCGENGEFHSFVFDGPIFNHPVSFTVGETIFKAYQAPEKKDTDQANSQDASGKIGFWFCDLLPVNT